MAQPTSRYIHGSALKEQARLSMLNDLLNRPYIGMVAPKRGDRILDLGSGLGQFTAMMARRAGKGSVVIGIERDRKQLATARRLLRKGTAAGRGRAGAARIELRRGDATRLSLAPGEWESFDLVHTRFLLEHVPDPAGIVRAMARAVRPGGRVFISDDDHAVFRLTPEPRGFRRLWRAYERSYEALGNDPYVSRHLVRHMRAAGLHKIRIGGMFFGACADEKHFEAIADNLIGILEGARGVILRKRLMGKRAYERAMEALRGWKEHPEAAQWYTLYWAAGVRPSGKSRRS